MKTDPTLLVKTPMRPGQRGAALVLSLVMLMIMSVIGVTAMNRTSLDEKMAGNLRNRTLAFEAAEAALRDAGATMADWSEAPVADDSGTNDVFENGSLPVSPEPADLVVDDDDDLSAPAGMTEYDGIAGRASNPKYAVEEVAFVPDDLSPETLAKRIGVYHYSVTSLGFGNTTNSRAMLQAVVTKRFN